ncbi:hypothetical protein Q75_05370 [Bacillus coahuilensis p1.1.43]|uniref:UPF0637 protein Q75_05370 n=1 Tax=Bacillus coahuilensis p1.1.43 TaxID=1150625 RepID=A0A147KAE7_9BACI|nr:DUF1054 domain-containing protein [Bacillus coahuilensis]KUP07656.1 hypothetical protein Q75_05370 [Bacillus coahuilensis p1.1.43]
MSTTTFSQSDFDIFKIDGLEPRMEALVSSIRPKLEALGQEFAPTLSALVGEEIHYHVAKHARRSVNPPADTWVAFAPNKRGYKMHPHFQIGLWESHVFIWFAVIYEVQNKEEFGRTLQDNLSNIQSIIPSDFVWSGDHTKPDSVRMDNMSSNDLSTLFERLQTVKKAEILCGYRIFRDEFIKLTEQQWHDTIHNVFVKTVPLYKMA